VHVLHVPLHKSLDSSIGTSPWTNTISFFRSGVPKEHGHRISRFDLPPPTPPPTGFLAPPGGLPIIHNLF
jgi:hypothetical protein